MTGVLKVDDIKDAGANSIVSSNGSGTLTFGSFTAPNITASTAILPDASDGAAIGSASLEWSDLFLADGAVINLGDDQDVTLTHVADTGIQLNSTMKLMFNDASQFIQGSSATVLSIGATDEIDLTATAVDLNGTLNVSGVATFQAAPVFPDGSLALADLDIDGATDIGAAIVDADLFIVDDGAGGTNRKVTASRIKTYAGGVAGISSSADATAMTITSAEKIGIGETTPLALVHIKQADSGQGTVDANTSQLVIEDDSTAGITLLGGTSGTGAIFFGDSGDNDAGLLEYDHGGNTMIFKTGAVQRLKLGTEVAVNDDSTDTGAAVFKVKGAQNNDVAIYVHKNTSGSETMFRFRDGDQTTCGTIGIDTGGNTVSYNTSSDYRLKKNEVEITDGITKVKSLKPYRFNWKSKPDGDKVDGFFAHEAKAVVPESVQGEKDAFEKYREHQEIPEGKNVGDFKLDDNGDKIPNYQQIDQAKLVPVLTAALKEAIAKIETLETKVKALEDA